MFFAEVDDRQFAVKPMNCPTHCLIYGTRLRSYRDLPIRYGDFGRLHRYERSGVTTGLTRVRTFAQDDAHIFCTPEQVESEVLNAVALIQEIYQAFGFDQLLIELSTRPEKRLGSDELWDQAEAALSSALDKSTSATRSMRATERFTGPRSTFKSKTRLGASGSSGPCNWTTSFPSGSA